MRRSWVTKLVLVVVLAACFLGQSIATSAAPPLGSGRSEVVSSMIERGQLVTGTDKQLSGHIVAEAAVAAVFFLAAFYAQITDSLTRYADHYSRWWNDQSRGAALPTKLAPLFGTLNSTTSRVFDPV